MLSLNREPEGEQDQTKLTYNDCMPIGSVRRYKYIRMC